MIEEQISTRLKNERAAIAANEGKKAREAAANELETQQKQVIELQQVRLRHCHEQMKNGGHVDRTCGFSTGATAEFAHRTCNPR
jgi:hypothetical protein